WRREPGWWWAVRRTSRPGTSHPRCSPTSRRPHRSWPRRSSGRCSRSSRSPTSTPRSGRSGRVRNPWRSTRSRPTRRPGGGWWRRRPRGPWGWTSRSSTRPCRRCPSAASAARASAPTTGRRRSGRSATPSRWCTSGSPPTRWRRCSRRSPPCDGRWPDASCGAEPWRRLRARCAWRALAGGTERRGAAHERLPAHERPAAPAGLPGPAVGVERAGEPAAGPLDVDVQRVEGRAARGERLAHDVLRGGEHVDGGPLGELVRGAARVEPGTPEGLVGVDVADAGDERLVQQGPLDLGTPRAQPPGEAGAVECRVERVAGDVRGRLGQRRQRGAVAAGAAVHRRNELGDEEVAEGALVDEPQLRPVGEVELDTQMTGRVRGDAGCRGGCRDAVLGTWALGWKCTLGGTWALGWKCTLGGTCALGGK